MITIREYKKVQSLEEAYELNQKKSNRIIGGMIWLKMETLNVGTAIDLSDLGLDAVEETETEFRIGAMTTLRTLETHEGLAAYTNGAMRESVRHIVGVQLRNLATLGGSLYSRFGFSDVLTMFLALDASVELYKGGIVPLCEYAERKKDRDVLVRVIVPKKVGARFDYRSVRPTRTDLPTLTCASVREGDGCRFVIGSRPARAMIFAPEAGSAEQMAEQVQRVRVELARHRVLHRPLHATALLVGQVHHRQRRQVQERLQHAGLVADREGGPGPAAHGDSDWSGGPGRSAGPAAIPLRSR